MGYDRYTVAGDCSCRTYFCCFPLALTNTFPWPFQFFQISLKNSELKTTHNAFRDCRVYFFRQPFSKQLYTNLRIYTCHPSRQVQSESKHNHYPILDFQKIWTSSNCYRIIKANNQIMRQQEIRQVMLPRKIQVIHQLVLN